MQTSERTKRPKSPGNLSFLPAFLSLPFQVLSQPGSKAEKDASLDARLSFHDVGCGEQLASCDYGTSMPVISQMKLDPGSSYL